MCATTVNFAPMLCVLFLAARMRAVQIDPNGAPQDWARRCFYACTFAVLGQTLLALVCAGISGNSLKDGLTEGDVSFEVSNPALAVLNALRWILMVGLYVCTALVLVSIFTIAPANPSQVAPAISMAVKCIIGLTTQYFVVYLALWSLLVLQEAGTKGLDSYVSALQVTKETVMMCPMLCVLFIGTRLRALEITNDRGNPQGWVQECMCIAAFATALQTIMILIVGLMTENSSGSPSGKVDPAGTQEAVIFQYICTTALYAGILGVIYGLFTMTPRNANGLGTIFPNFAQPQGYR